MLDSLGDRIKENYEGVFRHKLMRRTPVIIRVDGKAFHTFTRGLERPASTRFRYCMLYAATETAKKMQGFKLYYTQSDEVSFLLTDYDRHETEPWFGYVKSKLESISASLMSVYFNKAVEEYIPEKHNLFPVFDARAFNVPREEVTNYFLWRANDCNRNSMQMLAQYNFSHRELKGKNTSDMNKMLSDINVFIHKEPLWFRNGTFYDGVEWNNIPNLYERINGLIIPYITEV